MPRKFEPLNILPRRLRMAMEAREMTSADLVRRTALGSGQISQYLNGHQEPGATRIAQLCAALDVSADFLIGLSDEMKIHKPRGGDLWTVLAAEARRK